MSTALKHPTRNYEVTANMDPCHMLKLASNSLADSSLFYDPEGNKIEWKYFKELHKIKENEGLKLGNKLPSSHMNCQKNKMKMLLAAQTLSSSVADPFDFLREGFKIEAFQSSENTVKFVRHIDRLFNILNSRTPLTKGFKQPLRLAKSQRCS